ncbi:MAG: hypothetical protein EON91_03085 [Brevundimonas sp.]|uniref:hypothetical protein n=1 Tax=Brevundimonas sp. TaxID=1871086 RepID=UPI00122304C2|nr:hypothetical protein [Brevundimonas sp.]RZJ19019.1 MAG: hypothetical protein EON91_03085 [Brevundimonas sp.]
MRLEDHIFTTTILVVLAVMFGLVLVSGKLSPTARGRIEVVLAVGVLVAMTVFWGGQITSKWLGGINMSVAGESLWFCLCVAGIGSFAFRGLGSLRTLRASK